MIIQESAEMYLETILVLFRAKGYVRSIDISNYMGFSKPSVSESMKKLRQNGYILMDESGHITLTDKGLEIAENIYERHNVLAEFFIKIGVSESVASSDACKVEHDISDETFAKLKSFLEKM